jgi:hypothetical protein
MAALQQLPCLSSLDLNRCLTQQQQQQQQGAQNGVSAASQQAVSLMALLTGSTKQQQQQQQQQLLPGTFGGSAVASTGPAAATAEPAAALAVRAPALSAVFSSLKCLQCTGVDFVFQPAVWGALSHLSHLNVAGCSKFKGEGLSQLTGLQELIASGMSLT